MEGRDMSEPKPPLSIRRGGTDPVENPAEPGGWRSGKPGPRRKVDVADYYITKTVRVSPSLARDLRMAAAHEDISETELIITLILPGIQEIKRRHREELLQDLDD